MVESVSFESIRSAYIQVRTIACMQEVTADRISKPKLREVPHRVELQRRHRRQFLDECEGSFGHRDRRTIWILDAHRSDGKRFVVRADEKLTAFLELGW